MRVRLEALLRLSGTPLTGLGADLKDGEVRIDLALHECAERVCRATPLTVLAAHDRECVAARSGPADGERPG